ncbi:MAG: hypothetical protein U0264_00225 [Candidatus Kapaibacterium sp.]
MKLPACIPVWLCCLCVSMSMTAAAQESIFKVLMTQGVVEGQKPGTKTWFRVYPTVELPSYTKIRLAANAYATFISSESVLVEYDKKGSYELKPTKKAKNISSLQKISNFVNQAMKTGPQADLVGSIVRNAGAVKVHFPFDTKVLTPTVTLQWHADKAENFEVKLTDERGIVVYSKKLRDTALTLNLSSDIREFKRGVCYYWSVSNSSLASSGSAPACIMYLDEDEALRLDRERTQLKEEVDFSPSKALSWYILGAWYEDRKLYSAALESYSTCMKLHPTVDIYKNAVKNFLEKFQTTK